MGDKVRIVFGAYRDATARFGSGFLSKVVSMEMNETVGHELLPGYFTSIDECLRPGGLASVLWLAVSNGTKMSYNQRASLGKRMGTCGSIDTHVALFSCFFNLFQLTEVDNMLLPHTDTGNEIGRAHV